MESLDPMARRGSAYAILAPYQAKAVRPMARAIGRMSVERTSIPSRAYEFKGPQRETMALFFYDGPISQAVAFEKLLHNGEEFAKRLTGAFSSNRTWNQLMHIATDGETYGHHHRHGEMALAYALDCIESKKLAKITNYGEFLEKNPPTYEAQIFENTSWSCVHGVERWRSNCGCNAGRRLEPGMAAPLARGAGLAAGLDHAALRKHGELPAHRSMGGAQRLHRRCSESHPGDARSSASSSSSAI